MKHRILVVEDDAAVLEVLQLMLSEKFDVIVATNGKEGVRLYESLKPDLVLMDIVMPEMDGVQATREILKKDPNAKILAITAYASHRGHEMLEAGALEIIEKPFTKKQLIETIEKHLES
jgi:CheY-like chemotaxis protein